MLGGLLQFLGAAMAVDHQAGALLRKAIGDCSAYPTPTSTCHDRDLAFETHMGESSH
jgi:hypothetical protein